MTMKLFKDLFTIKRGQTDPPAETQSSAPHAALELDALDDCVGGRSETDGVGCYVHSTQSTAH
jgi:hypothetical protein